MNTFLQHFKTAILLYLAIFGLSQKSFSQLYNQQFATTLAASSNSSITTGTYCNTTPSNSQLNFIGSNGPGCGYEVPAGTQKLTFTRTANAGTFVRSSEFSPVPTSAFIKFDVTVSGNTITQTNGAMFQMGFGLTSNYAAENSSKSHANLGINWTGTNGQFSLRNAQNNTSTSNFTGTQTVLWVINNSATASQISYMGPDGNLQTVADDKEDVWIGNTLVFDDMSAWDGARSLRTFKFIFTAGLAKIELDNFTVDVLPAAPVATSQAFCASSASTVANLTATGSDIKWYAAASGGSPLLSTNLLTTGNYYVSQNPFGLESIRTLVAVSLQSPPTVFAGPAMASIAQGATSAGLGGTFGSSATGAVWSASIGTFSNNTGATPSTATYTAAFGSPATVTLTITTIGSSCPQVSASKTITITPPVDISGVINQYGEIIAPSFLPVGSLVCTLAAGLGSQFAPGDRAMIIQMKGVSVSLPASPTDETYGYITAINNSGNHEFLNIGAINGDIITFERCVKKNYTIWGSVQLIKVPQYPGSITVKGSKSVSAIRLTRKGMGYAPNSTITTGFTVTPTSGGAGLTLQAITDNNGQINEVQVLNAGSGYNTAPLITLPLPTVSPFNVAGFRAKALAVMGLTAMQWNGKRGGILAFEVNGTITLQDSIHMTGMGFSGGMIGDKAAVNPTCGASAEYNLDFSNYTRAGQLGEGIATIPLARMRGKGRYATGGGGGVEPEGGGGGGANWQDGGVGGGSSYTLFPTSACSTTVTLCDKDALRGGLGGGTQPSTPVGLKNVLRANSYNYQPDFCRIFLGAGGGGAHAFSGVAGSQTGGGGGFGGGIIIMKADALTSNSFEILANGEKGENATGDGAGGGGAGGAILVLIDTFNDQIQGRINGGNGGNSISTVCSGTRLRYFGGGGGGGGGVVWFPQVDVDVTALAIGCNIGQANQGNNDDAFNNTAKKGQTSRSQSELVLIENVPYLGSSFTVGGTHPKPSFPTLTAAASWLAFKGSDASNITLLVTENTSSPSIYGRYASPAIFTRIFTPGCTYGDANLIVTPKTTTNSVNLMNEIDDLVYITLDGIPSVTFRNLKILGSFPYINTQIRVKNNSKLFFDNVDANTDIFSEDAGINDITLSKSKNAGVLNIGANQILNITDSLTVVGDNTYSRSLSFASGSILNMPAGTKLNLQGASWANNGAASFNIDPTAKLSFTGSFTGQKIGGTATTNFNELNVSNTGGIAINTSISVKRWLQTSNSIVNHGANTLTISEKVNTATGRFTGSGPGKVLLSNSVSPVEVQGRFFNLDINASANAMATADVTIDNGLLLNNGRLDLGANLAIIETTSATGVSNTSTSWVNGVLRRKVIAGTDYSFPIGTGSILQKASVKVNSVSGGLQYLNAGFNAGDPNTIPVNSIVTPYQEGLSYFSAVSPEGFWSINPNAGSANYDIALFPSFYGSFTKYSIFKRSTGGFEWAMFGSLSNPESSLTFIQSDGSVRRTGLVGFSDFSLAGGEEPLPLDFIDFQATKKRNSTRLNWKMADCLNKGRFSIFKGNNTSNMSKMAVVNVDKVDCSHDFEFEDLDENRSISRVYYRIHADAEGEKPAQSQIRVVNSGSSTEKPFLSMVQNENKKFELIEKDFDCTGLRVIGNDGRVLVDNQKPDGNILNLNHLPNGIYLVEMLNNGWTVRQRIIVGF